MAVSDTESIIWILNFLVKCDFAGRIYQQSLLALMETGVFVNLLLRMDVLTDLPQQDCWDSIFITLHLYIDTNLKNTSMYERSIYYKSKIFERTPVLVNAAEKLGDSRVVLAFAFLIYGNFVQIAGFEYCRSTIRSHVQDGTLRKMAQLLLQHIQNDHVFNMCSLLFTNIFVNVVKTDDNSLYNKPCNKITAELQLTTPIFIKVLGRKPESENDRRATLTALTFLNRCLVVSQHNGNLRFLNKHMLTKSISDQILWELRPDGAKDLFRTKKILELSLNVLSKVKGSLKTEHLRLLLPYLIKLMRQVNLTLTSEEESLLFASINITCLLVHRCTSVEENCISDILRMKLIPVWVSIIERYHISDKTQLLKVIASIVFGINLIVEVASPEQLLTLIDQVIPCFPFLVYCITDRTDLNLEATPQPDFSIATWCSKLFYSVTRRLTHDIYDRLGRIDPQLTALIDSGLVCGIGKALITFKDHQTMWVLWKVCTELFYVDERKIIKKLVVFLPEIIEKSKQLKSFYHDASDKDNIYYQLCILKRKSVAYAIEDISLTWLLEEQVFEQILSMWTTLTFDFSNGRIQLPLLENFALHDDEHYYDGDAIAEIMRASWAICQHYPEKVSDILDLESFLPDGWLKNKHYQVARELMRLILELVASYLNHSEEYSKDFLLHITGFVKDLDIDPWDVICKGLLAACQRFLKEQNDRKLTKNVSAFTERSVSNLEQELLLHQLMLEDILNS